MRINKILSQHRNDFTAEMVCEHCCHTGKLTSGYFDDFYMNHVIPSMLCKACGLNQKGHTQATSEYVNIVEV